MTDRPEPSALAYVPFVSVDNMMRLVNATGVEEFLRGLAGYIEADFLRWPEFDKTPRVASHSKDGVIRPPMPKTTDSNTSTATRRTCAKGIRR